MKGDHHVILRVVAKALIPIIALYGFYVQFHGEYSPGGGFQAGVILAVSVILYSLIFGIAPTMRAITPGFARFIAGLGFILYVSVGVWLWAETFWIMMPCSAKSPEGIWDSMSELL